VNLAQSQRLLKSILSLSIALWAGFVVAGNLLHYAINFQFVEHVLAMDSLQPWLRHSSIQSRALSDPLWVNLGYQFIIFGELMFAVMMLYAGCKMLIATLKQQAASFDQGKMIFTLGCIPGLLVWFVGFNVIGSEYFYMWANQWNGQTSAFLFIIFILLSLIFISQPERVLAT
jgi:predicted small integral membrane protein